MKTSMTRWMWSVALMVGGLCVTAASTQAAWHVGSAVLGTVVLPLRASGMVLADFNGDGQLEAAVPGLYVAGVAVMSNSGTAWYDAGKWPIGLAAGDFDSDGDVDLAVVLKGEGGIAILTNDGSGSFTRTAFYDTGAGTIAAAAVDLNNNGLPDLVVANHLEGTVIRMINTGSGAFAVQPDLYLPAVLLPGSPEVSSEPNAFAIGDFNGDNWLDVAVACSGDDSVKVLRNRYGMLTLAATYDAGPRPVAVAAGDLNWDGLADLVVADAEAPQVTVLLRDATGLFSSQDVFFVPVPYGAFNPPTDVALVDTAGYGTLDIRCDGYLLTNNRVGQFTPAPSGSATESVYAAATLPGDAGTYLAVYDSGAVDVEFLPSLGRRPAGDVNDDGHVNVGDLQGLVALWGLCDGDAGFLAAADLNSDGCINVSDLQLLAGNWGKS